jgi:formylglycine-generating enzyme required for sulfatase activity
MRRWFLSYHSPDHALAERLKAALESKDTNGRVFFAPTSLRAGGFWSRALADEIAQANAFILLVGENGVGDWQELEYDEALEKRVKSPDFAVVLVLLKGQTAPGLPFLRRLHWIITKDPASENVVAQLIDAAAGTGARLGELWRYTSPYRGLAAMEEKDSDYFFGREQETVDVLSALAAAADQLPVLLGNSGVGKSSLARAGVLAALKRQAWPERASALSPWPHAFQKSRRWCFLTLKPGSEPLKALVESFLNTWQLGATDPERVKHQNGWIELLRHGKATIRDLLDATERRYEELDRSKPRAFLLYIDQGEELYVRAEQRQRRRFSEVIVESIADPRLYMLMSMRADFLGELQRDEPLYMVHRKIDVTPLREAALRDVVSRPAELLSARFETDRLVDVITRRTGEDSVKEVGALPLLSYTLDDMWTQMVKRDDGVLRLPAQSFELGGVLVDRADRFLADHPKSQDDLRRILTLKLATVREGEEPTRRRALRSEFTTEEWRLVSDLADYPNRLLVTATPEGGEAYAEAAHEVIFRRWGKLRDWIAMEREFLAWKTGLERDHRRWEAAPAASKDDALLMGFALVQAQGWLDKRADDLSQAVREFVVRSGEVDSERREAARQLEIRRIKADEELARLRAEKDAREQRERADAEAEARREAELLAWGAHRRVRLLTDLVSVLGVIAFIAIMFASAWLVTELEWYTAMRAQVRPYLRYPRELLNWHWTMKPYIVKQVRPYVLTAEREQALKPKDSFRECAEHCPEMVVVPAGQFVIGSPTEEKGPHDGPQDRVVVVKPFAVSKFEVTMDQWKACVAIGGCARNAPASSRTGQGTAPANWVNWNDAKQYVAWLSRITDKPYRLLSDAEWEYAARAGSQTAYSWGDEVGKGNANCSVCGSRWDGRETAPVGSFAPNAFGLHDMHGNVAEWVEGCFEQTRENDCTVGVVRGGSWAQGTEYLRAAARFVVTVPHERTNFTGIRVGRTLITP